MKNLKKSVLPKMYSYAKYYCLGLFSKNNYKIYLDHEKNNWQKWAPKYLFTWQNRFRKFGYNTHLDDKKALSSSNFQDWADLKKQLQIDVEGEITIAEIGCGPSGIGHCIDRKNIHTICVDPLLTEYQKIDFYKENVFGKLKNKTLYTSLAESLPINDNSVDVAFCINVLDHCKNPTNVLDEIKRILKPGGFFVIDVDVWIYKKPFIMDMHPSRQTVDEVKKQLSERFSFVSDKVLNREVTYNSSINGVLLKMQSSKIKLGELFGVLSKP